jgi:prominin 1
MTRPIAHLLLATGILCHAIPQLIAEPSAGDINKACDSNLVDTPRVAPADEGLSGWYRIGIRFLNTLSGSNGIPYDTIRDMVDHYLFHNDDFSSASSQNYKSRSSQLYKTQSFAENPPNPNKSITQWAKILLNAQKGYLAALAFGILFVILMPIVGLIFCCCRCCDRCGGKRYQAQPSSCGRITVVILAILAILSLVAGMAMYGFSNQFSWHRIPSTRDAVEDQVDNILEYGNGVLSQMFCGVEDAFSTITTDVVNDILSIPADMTKDVMNKTGLDLMEDTQLEIDQLLDAYLPLVIDHLSAAGDNVTKIADSINRFLNELPSGTVNATEKVKVNAELGSYNHPSAVSEIKSALTTAQGISSNPKYNFTSQTDAVRSRISDASTAVVGVASSVKETLVEANSSMVTVLLQAQSDVLGVLTDLDSGIRNATAKYISDSKLKSYAWVPSVLLLVLLPIVLVVLLLIFGVIVALCNALGDDEPHRRSSCSNHAGNCQLAAVGILFLVSSIMMLVTVLMFTIGYGTQEFICRPLFDDEDKRMYDLLSEVIDDSKAIDVDYRINLYSMVTQCKNNSAVFNAMNLSTVVNLHKIVDVIKNVSIDPDEFGKFNNSDIYTLATDFANEIKTKLLPTFTILNESLELMETIYSREPEESMGLLNRLARDSIMEQHSKSTAQQLLTELKRWADGPRLETFNVIERSERSTASVIEQLNKVLVIASNRTSQRDELSQVITSTIEHVNKLKNDVADYAISVVSFIEDQIGPCKSLYIIFQNLGTVVCQDILNSIHGLWLSLGWCLVWFIPTVVIATLLARYLHRMNKSYYADRDRVIPDPKLLQLYNMPSVKMGGRPVDNYHHIDKR